MNIFKMAASVLLASGLLFSDTVTFEQFNDGDRLTNQVAGLTFSSAAVLTAGISLNELEFPPHSGVNAVFDDGGPITISFASPVSAFSGYFTYTTPLKLKEFDSNNQLLASVSSQFTSNLAISGDPGSHPNELFQIFFLAPIAISKVTVTGDPAGGSFTMDDISFQSATVSTVPEPHSVLLSICGATCLLGIAKTLRKVLQ
jgi:hypothetical protein